MQINNIFQGDCVKLLENLPHCCVDLIITDPPYGDNIGYGRHNKKILGNEDETLNYKIIDLCYSILMYNRSFYIFTNWKFVDKIRNYVEKNTSFKIRELLIIVKNNIGMGYSFRQQYEMCLVLEKGKPKYNLNNFSNVQYMEHIEHTPNTHPHQKGLKLIKNFILHSSKENDMILDPFAGSGTMLVAAKELKRRFIGYEIDSEYCKIAKKRLFAQTDIKGWF